MCPKIGVWVSKARSCDMPSLHFFNVNPHWVMVIRRGGSQKLRGRPRYFHAVSVTRPLLLNTTQGGGGGGGFTLIKKSKPGISQLRALATHTPILGRIAQGALELGLPHIRKCHFFEWPLRVSIYLLRKGVCRPTYICLTWQYRTSI